MAFHVHEQEGLGAHQLGDFHFRLHLAVGELFEQTGFVVDVLRTDAHDELFIHILFQHALDIFILRQRNLILLAAGGLGILGAELHEELAVLLDQLGLDEVHLRAADKAGDEHVAGRIVQVSEECPPAG